MPEGKYGDGFQKLRENPCWRGQQMDTMALGWWPQQTWDNTAGAEEEFSLTIPHPHISLTIATNPLAPLPCICKVQSKKQEAHWDISKRPGFQAQNRVGKGEEGWGGVVQIKHTHWHYFFVCFLQYISSWNTFDEASCSIPLKLFLMLTAQGLPS